MAEAFYLPSGGGFEPTELTRGPWDPRAQHAGPPAALVGRAVELAGRDGLRMRRAELALPGGLDAADSPPPGPEHGEQRPFFPTGAEVGYHTAMEWRFVSGSFLDPGPATVWLRMRHPLLPGEPPSPLTRVLIAADSGNGVSAVLDYRRFLFVNPDLTVHLQR